MAILLVLNLLLVACMLYMMMVMRQNLNDLKDQVHAFHHDLNLHQDLNSNQNGKTL